MIVKTKKVSCGARVAPQEAVWASSTQDEPDAQKDPVQSYNTK